MGADGGLPLRSFEVLSGPMLSSCLLLRSNMREPDTVVLVTWPIKPSNNAARALFSGVMIMMVDEVEKTR